MIPKGTALNGIIPNVIMAMLMVRPLISGVVFSCIIVMFSDIYRELVSPTMIRNGIAIQNTEI